MTAGSVMAPAALDATWLAHRFDPDQDAIHFRRLTRAGHREVTFITDEYLPAGPAPLVVRRADALAMRPSTAPIHFIFHSAFCCSTLLARAIDREGSAMGLKEPVILNDLVGWKRRGGDPRGVAQALDAALTLLARPFEPGEAVVVKPSNIVNCLAPAMLAMRPQARALLLYAPLRTYLASIAKKGLDGRLWVRTLFLGLLKDGIVDLGFDEEAMFGQTDLQIAAAGWLVQHQLFARLIERHGPEHVRTLDSERLTDNPEATMTAIAELFALPLDTAAIRDIVAGPAFAQHAKLGGAFDRTDRAAEHRSASELHADEIEKVAIWAEAVAGAAGIALVLPAGLLA